MNCKSEKFEKAFTLIELMVVIFIVGILTAVAIPYMRGRSDASKWTEGKTGAGSIRTAARAYCAEKGPAYDYAGNAPGVFDIGFAAGDLDGRYFSDSDYSIDFYGFNDFDITVVNTSGGGSGEPPTTPTQIVMDESGSLTVTP